MPRRVIDFLTMPDIPRKKNKSFQEDVSSLDISFEDDEALPPGIVFTDVQTKKWRLGKPIGRGSFGRIYLASDDVEKDVTNLNARYVVKIEPHTNGPLFVEVHCLIRTAHVSKVKAWRSQNKQRHLGMPIYIASGSFTDEKTDTKYRFLVLPRYDIDLQKVIERTKVLDLKNVLVLGIQILDVLEYFHSQGYTHSDIKSSNLVIGFDGNKFSTPMPIKKAPLFQKDTKRVSVLTRKIRKVKSNKCNRSSYYNDEDYIIEDKNSLDFTENDKRLAKVKSRLKKMLSDKDSRTLHRHHALNLRQLNNYVDYADLSSSVCSDQSYQNILDDFNCKIEEECEINGADNSLESKNDDVIYEEAVLTQSNRQIYLLDYGLACKFVDSDGNHKAFGMDARKAHDGTLEYSSRDSHIGAHSRRSDLETLGYNLLEWLTGTLPWKRTEVLTDPNLVHALKKNYMSDVKSLLAVCFKSNNYPQFLERYLQYVNALEFTEKPDYDYCRKLFRNELAKQGHLCDKEVALNFIESRFSPMQHKKFNCSKKIVKKVASPDFISRNKLNHSHERENVSSYENDLKLELLKQTLNSSSDGVRKPCVSRNFFVSDADLVARLKKSLLPQDILGKKLSPKNLRSNRKNAQKRKGKKIGIGKFGNFMGSAKQFTWAEILARNPEDILRKERNTYSDSDMEDYDDNCRFRIRRLSDVSSDSSDTNVQSPLLQKDYLASMNPTYAMKEVIANLKKKLSNKPVKEQEDEDDCFQGFTPIMIKLYKSKEKREAKEKMDALKETKQTELKKVVTSTNSNRSSKAKNKKNVKSNQNNEKLNGEGNDKNVSAISQLKTTRNGQKNVEVYKNTANSYGTRSKGDAMKKKTCSKKPQDFDLKSSVTKNLIKNNVDDIVKNDVKIVSQPKKTPIRNDGSKKTPKKSSCTVVTTNRRRLRSSRRNKK